MLLIGLRRIYIDSETKQAIEFEIPIFGKLKTQAPAFAIIAVGAGMVAYPLSKSHADLAVLSGQIVTDGKSVNLLIVPGVYQYPVDASGPFTTPFPILPNTSYRVKVIVDKQIVDEQAGSLSHNQIVLERPFRWDNSHQQPLIPPKKDITDEELRKYHITP